MFVYWMLPPMLKTNDTICNNEKWMHYNYENTIVETIIPTLLLITSKQYAKTFFIATNFSTL